MTEDIGEVGNILFQLIERPCKQMTQIVRKHLIGIDVCLFAQRFHFTPNICTVDGLSGPALGRPKKDAEIDKKQNYIDECERVEVERKFSLAKRKCGMDMIVTRLKETTCHSIAMSVLLLNLRRIEKLRAEILWLIIRSLKLGFVQ